MRLSIRALVAAAPAGLVALGARAIESPPANDCPVLRDAILAVVTFKGPAESTGRPPFRSSLSGAIEEILGR